MSAITVLDLPARTFVRQPAVNKSNDPRKGTPWVGEAAEYGSALRGFLRAPQSFYGYSVRTSAGNLHDVSQLDECPGPQVPRRAGILTRAALMPGTVTR